MMLRKKVPDMPIMTAENFKEGLIMICRETTLTECLDTINRLKEMTYSKRYKESKSYKQVVDMALESHKKLARRFIDEL